MEGNERIFQYRFLPKPVRDFFLDSGLDDIELIAKTHGLSQNAIDELDNIQQEVLFGYEPIDKIPNLLKVRLKYDDTLAKEVTLDLIEKRFLPLDAFLQATAFRVFAQLGGNVTVVNIKRVDNIAMNVSQVRRRVEEFVLDSKAAELAATEVPEPAKPDQVPAESAKPEPVEAKLKPVEQRESEPVIAKPEIAEKKPEPIVVEPKPIVPEKPKAVAPEAPKPVVPEKPKVIVPEASKEIQDPKLQSKPESQVKARPQGKSPAPPPPRQEKEFEPGTAPLREKLREMDKVMDSDKEELKGEAFNSGLVSGTLDPSHELAPPPPMVVEAPKPTGGRKGRRIRRRAVIQPIEADTPRIKEQPPRITEQPPKNVEAKFTPKQVEPIAVLASEVDVPAQKPVQEKVIKLERQPVKPQSTPAKPSAKGSILDIEHEAEIANIVNELKESGDNAPRALNHPKIDEVQRKLSLSFPSNEIQKRFRVLVGSRLSGVRTIDDFKLALERPIAKGGLALDKHTADRVIEVIEGHKVTTGEAAQKKAEDGKKEYVEKRTEKYKQTTVKQPAENPTTVKNLSVQSGKGPVTDVRKPKRLIGPIDEIRHMNVDDFRRMPGSIADAIENIKDDIFQIGQHDPGRHIKAIEAWRGSPLVKYYQSILSQTLQTGAPVKKTLSDREANPKKLTIEEFDGIRSLNSNLRY
jgi:hypothetical protein